MVSGAGKMKGVEFIDLKAFGDERGSLIALESLSKQVPFDIKRVYYIFGVKDSAVRGRHAHYKLKQLLICVNGSVDIMAEDGKEKKIYHLDSPSKALYIEGLIWHDMRNFSKDAVIVVLASEHYKEEDYVRDYEKFLKEVQK